MEILINYQNARLSADDVSALSEHILALSLTPPTVFTFRTATVHLRPATTTQICQYKLATAEPEPLEVNNTTLFTQQQLPHAQFEGHFEHLYFEQKLKSRMAAFPGLAMQQTPKSIQNLSMHRMMLL